MFLQPLYAHPMAFAALPTLTTYTKLVSTRTSPGEVLDALHRLTMEYFAISVLGAARLPFKNNDWVSVKLGKNVFIHQSVPKGWWEEYAAAASRHYDPGLIMARSSLMGYTWVETMKMLDPVGLDRWWYELSYKYGMRDGMTCPVGGRWVVGFWSPKPFSHLLTDASRIVIYGAASFAALRVDQIIGPDLQRAAKLARQPTPRELAVLRLMAAGKTIDEIAKSLGLGEETIRSHLKKAQAKLGAHNRPHAVAEAMRQRLIV
jgi:LuxR family quorum sensing-dependent transcriptional regulator